MANYRGKLEVTLIQAADLRDTEAFGKQDPYLKVGVGDRGSTSVSYKTSVKDGAGTSATFNETFIFNLEGKEELLKVSAWDKERMSDDKIGSEWFELGEVIKYNNKNHWYTITINGDKPAGKIELLAKFEGTGPDGEEIKP